MPVERIKEFQAKLTEFLTTRKAELLAKIGTEKALSDALDGRVEGRGRPVQADCGERTPSSMSYAQPSRPSPAHQVDQQHRADHQGDADGGGLEDAQGAAGGARRTRPFARLLYRIQRSATTHARSISRIRCWRCAKSASARSSWSAPTRVCAARSTATCSALAAQFDPAVDGLHHRRTQGAQFVARTRRQLAAEFAYGDTPRFAEARAIAAFARDLFLKGEVDRGADRRARASSTR